MAIKAPPPYPRSPLPINFAHHTKHPVASVQFSCSPSLQSKFDPENVIFEEYFCFRSNSCCKKELQWMLTQPQILWSPSCGKRGSKCTTSLRRPHSPPYPCGAMNNHSSTFPLTSSQCQAGYKNPKSRSDDSIFVELDYTHTHLRTRLARARPRCSCDRASRGLGAPRGPCSRSGVTVSRQHTQCVSGTRIRMPPALRRYSPS